MNQNTNTIKKAIVENFAIFTPVKSVADVQATIRGTQYRVVIQKGTALKVTADKKPVWTPESGIDLLDFLSDIVNPIATKKGEASMNTETTNENQVVETPNENQVVETGNTVEDLINKAKAQGTKAPKVKKIKAAKEHHEVNAEWLAVLTTEANKVKGIQAGDEIRFRVATSNGNPVCAHIDLHRDGKKVATAGIHHRVSFCTRGITPRWLTRVEQAVGAIYKNIGTTNIYKSADAMVHMNADGSVKKAEGTMEGLLELFKTIK